MSNYKLSYFDLKVLAEPVRWILILADQKFDDDRIEAAKWPEIKPTTPFGQLPVLTFDGGKTLTQSVAITEFLVRKHNVLLPKDPYEQAQCLEVILHIQDCRMKWAAFYMEKDPAKREEIRADLKSCLFVHFLGKFNEMVVKNGGNYIVGSSMTYADLWLANFLETWRDTIDDSLLDNYPALKQQMKNVFELPKIKEWVQKRPTGVGMQLFGLKM